MNWNEATWFVNGLSKNMNCKHLILPTITLVFATLLNGVVLARPLEKYEQEVNNLLQQAVKMSKEEGYQLSFPTSVAKLPRGAEAPRTVRLYPNQEYNIVAICDRNCERIGLTVKDMNGKNMISNPTNEPVAVMNFKPPSETQYQVTVKMEKCTAPSCYFGLGIFNKR